jgi:hypothetical protein
MASPLFPKSIEVNNASIDQLELLFTVATNDLQNYLFTLNGKIISRAQILQLRQDVNQRLVKLGADVGAWISTQIPNQYALGQHDAARQQAHFGDKAAAGVILGAIALTQFANRSISISSEQIISPKQEIFDLHNQSVQAIMDDMSASFGTSLNAMARSADQTISRIQALDIRRMIARGAMKNESADAISKQIADLIEHNGISALVDKAGKRWSPDVYARMLVRTKMAEARNNGMMNALTSIGHDLVEVSSHGASDSCGKWEGRILSISGNNTLYQSVADAQGSGDHIFGPNCKHGLNSVNPAFFPSGKKTPAMV